MEKRGQITVFIIVGIVLIILVGLFFVMRYSTTFFTPKEIVPVEAQPIQRAIDNCVRDLSLEAIEIIGTTGGFIRYPDYIDDDYFASLRIAPFDSIKMPYWYYEGESRIPSEDLMIEEINYHVRSNLRECVDDLEEFKEEFDIKERGLIESKTTLTPKNVIVEVDYPIEVADKFGNKITDMTKHIVTHNIKLKEVYDVAAEIMRKENRDMKIEDITMDLIALDPDVPYTDIEFSCNDKRWLVSEVRNKLKTLIRYNLPEIRIDKTDYNPISDELPYMQNHYVWSVTDKEHEDLSVSLTYDESWPFQFNVMPQNGRYLESNSMTPADSEEIGIELSSFLCMNMWKFTYNLKYPVTATVTDDISGYSFSFAFPVIISRNQGTRDVFTQRSFSFEARPDAEEYCSRRVNDITVNTYDNVTGSDLPSKAIDEVDISFTCLKYTCDLGQSEWEGNSASLSTKAPYCVNGIIRARKQGYQTAEVFVSTNEARTVDMYLVPLVSIDNFKVLKHPLKNLDVEESLSSGERAMIIVKNNEKSSYAGYPLKLNQTIDLLAGSDYSYDVTVTLFKEEDVSGIYKGNWTPTWAELNDAKEIIFPVIYDRGAEDDLFFSDIREISKNVSIEIR